MADSEIEELVAALEAEYERVVVEFIVECVANLREDTPVDTGHARANWVPSKSSPFTREVPGNSSGPAASGDASILSYTLDDGDAFIANNVDYIVGPGSLNDGHSSQAAAGFIEAAVARAIAKVSRDHEAMADFAVSVTGALQGL